MLGTKMISALTWIALLAMSLPLASCYSTRIAPKVHLRLMTSDGKPLAGLEGCYEASTYPSLSLDFRVIPFQTDSNGVVNLESQRVWVDIFSRFGVCFMNILLPHGYNDPRAVVRIQLPKDLELDPARSGLVQSSIPSCHYVSKKFQGTKVESKGETDIRLEKLEDSEFLENCNHLNYIVYNPRRIKVIEQDFYFDKFEAKR